MSNRVRTWWLAGLLTGCATAPQNQYYVLSPAAATDAAAVSPDLSEPAVTVRLPALLDREQIVEGTGPQAVQIREFDRWAAPLDEMIPRILIEDLTEAEAGDCFARKRRIAVEIDEFMAGADGIVRLTGTWSELPEQKRSIAQTWRFSLRTPADAQRISSVAASMSRLLEQLADAIARASSGAG